MSVLDWTAPFLREYSPPVLNRKVAAGDGVELDTLRLGRAPGRGVIVCHGFGGNKHIAGLVKCAQALAEDYAVYTFDFRGHGESGGLCTFAEREVDDLHAVVEAARADGNRRLAVLGFSMGGLSAIAYAARRGGLDSVLVMSVPCRLEEARAPGARFLRFLLLTAPGRAWLEHRFGVRMGPPQDLPESPASLVGRIPPQPLTIMAGTADYIFEVDQAEELHRLAGGASRLKVFEGLGHAEAACVPEMLAYVKGILARDLA